MIRVLVIGGQRYGGSGHVWSALDALHATVPFEMLIECVLRQAVAGRLVGAGYFAGRWAQNRGVVHAGELLEPGHELRSFRAILKARRPAVVVRFPGGRLTHSFAEVAAASGLTIVEAK